MQYGLTVDLFPSINPLNESEWQSYFQDEVEPQVVAKSSAKQCDYQCIVVKSDDKPILLVPLEVMAIKDQGLIESLVSDANQMTRDCANVVGYLFTCLFFGRRVTDPFEGKYVVASPSIVLGSALHKVALEQAFRVYTSLSKTMDVSLISHPQFDASTCGAAAFENLI